MMNAPEQPLNYKALSWTVAAHLVLLLLFAFWKFSSPAAAAPVQEMGMEVNLGTSDNGSGDDQPMDMDDPAAAVSVSERSASAAEEAVQERAVEETDEADAPEVATVKPAISTRRPKNTATPRTTARNTRPPAQPVARNAQPVPDRKPRYVYQGNTGKGGNSATANRPGMSEGNTSGDGDRGVPGGTPGAANYTGSPGRGTGGISHSLGGRNIVSFPPKEAEFRAGGRVVVRVTVNREGTIVNKQVINATNAELRPIALRKLGQVKFNRNENAPAEQFGNITFVFKTRN